MTLPVFGSEYVNRSTPSATKAAGARPSYRVKIPICNVSPTLAN